MMGQRFTLVMMAVCAVLLTASCGGNGTQSDIESGADGGDCSQVFTDVWSSPAISWALPDSYPTDWVNYAEQVSTVTVVQEIVDQSRSSFENVGRRVVLRVDRVLWAKSDEFLLTGTFEITTDGWDNVEEEGVIPARFGDRPRLEVGCQYLMPLVWWQDSEGEWGPLSEAIFWVGPDGTLQGGYDGSKRLHRNSQHPVEQVAEELARTPPCRHYEAFKHLPSEQRCNSIGDTEHITEIEATEALKEAGNILRVETDDPPLLLYGVTHDGRVGSRNLRSEYGDPLLYLYPYDDLSDWVTYAELVAVATVIGVAEGTERHYPGSASIIERQVELRIDEMLWTSPGAHSIAPGTVELRETAGWASLGNQRIPLVPSEGRRFEPGHRYVVPLVREVRQVLAQSGNEVVIEDFWVLLHRNAVLEIADDGTLFTGPEGNMRLSSSGSPRTFDNRQLWIDPEDKLLTVDQLTTALANAAPSHLYEVYKHLQPPARAQQIGDVEFRTTTP